MNEQISLSIVRIFTADKDVAGVGFLLSGKSVLTHKGIVARALGIDSEAKELLNKEIMVDFPLIAPGERIKAHVMYWYAGNRAAGAGTPVAGAEAAAGVPNWLSSEVAVLEMEHPPPKHSTHAPAPTPDDEHYKAVVNSVMSGKVVAFLGAGASLFGRPADFNFEMRRELFDEVPQGYRGMPTGGELAKYLARKFDYMPNDYSDLLRITQYIDLKYGDAVLYDELREIFNYNYEVTDLHRFFARLPSLLRAKRRPVKHQLIVTTNYDDLLERAFEQEDIQEPYDLVYYIAKGKDSGRFLHRRYNGREQPPETLPDGQRNEDYMPDGVVRVIDKPNEDTLLTLRNRSIILKIHGAVDRLDQERDSYVITEDNYIDFMARADISRLLPVSISNIMGRSHFLFLGYSLRDWNLRVILYRLWGEQSRKYKSWSIQVRPHPLDRDFWKGRGVDVLDDKLEQYIVEVEQRLRNW